MNTQLTMTIGGQATSSAASIPVIDPATGEVFAQAPDASQAQLDEAVAAARHAFAPWSATPLNERRAILGNVAGVLMTHLDTLATLLTQEQGKPLARAKEEIMISAHWCAEVAKLTPETITLEDTPDTLVQVRRVPLGVVGAIVPWNFPVALAFFKIAPALLTGNTVVLKPSPNTPLTALKLGELLRDVLPPGVLNVISGGDALGPWLSSHPGIDKISFTGSTATGRKVMASASATLKRLTLELGGNDAAIVMPDVDVDAIAPVLFWGAFANSAQFCLAIKRLYIHEDIYDKLADALAKLARQVRVGPGANPESELGPVQNQALFERLKGLVADCQSHGWRLLAGGQPISTNGYFFPATLVDNPPDSSRIVQEEPFGPILPLLRFRAIDEVIQRANHSPYGLGGSVWCRDQSLALSIAQRLQTGTVWVNEIHTLSPHKPMAGHKQSGLGVEQGIEGMLAYTQPQTISLKRSST
ncbi:MAG: aldehyde dehydrogenase family protein [Aquabacterium sp.]|uniref:aldehyde dehydrogenase family protein n=1 Tax=Aquabacterium sp. TaxID=1872578 RepID=UPI0025C6BE61|nr:aldehyde dehydrogenase family protein [Aquabacterium sp.]MBI3381813.1 aldehyde dehydrogenase family protein [Aquabacterium sp.]